MRVWKWIIVDMLRPEGQERDYPDSCTVGICKACGGERIIEVDPNQIEKALKALATKRTQHCGTGNPNDTWTLLEGYDWVFRGIANQIANPTNNIQKLFKRLQLIG